MCFSSPQTTLPELCPGPHLGFPSPNPLYLTTQLVKPAYASVGEVSCECFSEHFRLAYDAVAALAFDDSGASWVASKVCIFRGESEWGGTSGVARPP